ncbi:unnamed protein product [Gordionus sp. m RMFG-2023]
MAQFREKLSQEWNEESLGLIDLYLISSNYWMRNKSFKPLFSAADTYQKVSLAFNDIEPKEFANHFTYLDYKECRKITFEEFKNYATNSDVEKCPNLRNSIALFNSLSHWIQCMILNKTSPEDRAKIITKFVHVTKELLEINNYNTLMAIVGGLLHSSIARLSKTTSYLSDETKDALRDFSDMLSSQGNFQNYRREINKILLPEKNDLLRFDKEPSRSGGITNSALKLSTSEYVTGDKVLTYSNFLQPSYGFDLNDTLTSEEIIVADKILPPLISKCVADPRIEISSEDVSKHKALSAPKISLSSNNCKNSLREESFKEDVISENKQKLPLIRLTGNKNFCSFPETIDRNSHFKDSCQPSLPLNDRHLTGAPFRIPILGIHLKDLISINAAHLDYTYPEGGMINVRKMFQMYPIMNELTGLKKNDFPLLTDIDLINTLRLTLDMHFSEEDIYELSLAREPRNMNESNDEDSNGKMIEQHQVFAEWASDIKPAPDWDTLNLHINAMVEAVFKNYDFDKDGYISQAEFISVTENFPFIDSFAVLDIDKDGVISKEELKKYFYRANCHAFKSGFKHEFRETTYFKLTFCVHCTGLLWGLIKQGYRCKDCGINAHKSCKEVVVIECRSKTCKSITNNSHRSYSFAGTDKSIDTKRKTFVHDVCVENSDDVIGKIEKESFFSDSVTCKKTKTAIPYLRSHNEAKKSLSSSCFSLRNNETNNLLRANNVYFLNNSVDKIDKGISKMNFLNSLDTKGAENYSLKVCQLQFTTEPFMNYNNTNNLSTATKGELGEYNLISPMCQKPQLHKQCAITSSIFESINEKHPKFTYSFDKQQQPLKTNSDMWKNDFLKTLPSDEMLDDVVSKTPKSISNSEKFSQTEIQLVLDGYDVNDEEEELKDIYIDAKKDICQSYPSSRNQNSTSLNSRCRDIFRSSNLVHLFIKNIKSHNHNSNIGDRNALAIDKVYSLHSNISCTNHSDPSNVKRTLSHNNNDKQHEMISSSEHKETQTEVVINYKSGILDPQGNLIISVTDNINNNYDEYPKENRYTSSRILNISKEDVTLLRSNNQSSLPLNDILTNIANTFKNTVEASHSKVFTDSKEPVTVTYKANIKKQFSLSIPSRIARLSSRGPADSNKRKLNDTITSDTPTFSTASRRIKGFFSSRSFSKTNLFHDKSSYQPLPNTNENK